jgi:hypothetical protein
VRFRVCNNALIPSANYKVNANAGSAIAISSKVKTQKNEKKKIIVSNFYFLYKSSIMNISLDSLGSFQMNYGAVTN